MSIPQSVADILKQHVTFQLECIDRMYLNVYVPMLQCEGGVVKFFRSHRGNQFASSALMDPMTRAFVSCLDGFCKQEQIPVVQFRKGQRKDDVMKEHLARFDKPEGVVFVGKAQEKTPVFRTEKRRNPETGHTYPWIVPLDCALVGDGEPLLLLLQGSGVRSLLLKVLFLLPL
jgi:hypothetical protein